jgi:hypothetical protein
MCSLFASPPQWTILYKLAPDDAAGVRTIERRVIAEARAVLKENRHREEP